MKRIWRHKWIVIPVAAVIVLAAGAMGAVALAGPGDGGSGAEVASLVTGSTVQAAGDAGAGATQAVQELGKLRAKLQERLDRVKQRWADARAKMSTEDQAAFDQLQQKAKGQRETLQNARKDLAETLKQMRALVQKYHPATTTTSAP